MLRKFGEFRNASSRPHNASRPNQPMYIDPAADLAPKKGVIADSFFVTSNLKSEDHEFGILAHYMKLPFNNGPSIAITDVTDGKYYLDEAKGGKISGTGNGFEVKSDTLQWTANEQTMTIKGTMSSGEGSFDLTIKRQGPVLAYNGTGYFPLIDEGTPTWEFAYPVMETSGTVTVNGKTYDVTGNSWFDRQWFKSMGSDVRLGSKPGNTHWTWLSISLSNGNVVAVWDPVNKSERCWANILHPDGTLTIADVEPLSQNASDLWVSTKSGISWPSKWTVKIPGVQADLLVTSTAEGQETARNDPRIECVIHVTGTYEGKEVTGTGYAEIVEDPQLSK